MFNISISSRQILPLLGILLLATGAVIVEGSNADAILLLVSLSMLTVCALPAMFQKTYKVFEPLTFVIASVLLGCTLKAFYLVLFRGSNETVDGKLLMNLPIDSLIYGSMVLLVGMLFFTLGYLSVGASGSGNSSSVRSAWSYRKSVFWSGAITGVSLLAFLAFVQTIGASFDGLDSLSAKRFRDDEGAVTASRTGGIDYLLYRVALLAKLPLYVLFVIKLQRGFRMMSLPGFLLVLSGLLSVFVPFFVNNRAGVLLPLVDVGIITLMIRGRLNYGIAAAVAFAGIVIVVAGGVLRSEADLSSFYDQVFGGRYLIDLTKTAHIVNAYSGQGEYLNGLTLVSWIYQVLPFLKHPDPELVNLGFYLGNEVFGYLASGVPPGIVAELYINFGWFGVALGMILIGFFLKFMYERLGNNQANNEYMLIYALASTRLTIFLFNNGMSIAILKTALDIVALLGLFFLIRAGKAARASRQETPVHNYTRGRPRRSMQANTTPVGEGRHGPVGVGVESDSEYAP